MSKQRQPLDSWDVLPADMENYLKYYGRHFNKKMYEFAVSTMYKLNASGEKIPMEILTKEKYDRILTTYNVKIENDTLCDGMFVMSMAMSDFVGSSLPNDKYLAYFVKDYVDDVDKPDGFIFNRFYADCVLNGTPIEWSDML